MSAGLKSVSRRKALPASKQKLRLWLRLLRSTRAIESELRERLRLEFSETLPRFDVMAALWKCGEAISLTTLSRMLMVSNGNITGIVDRLVLDGSIMRVSDANDRRTTLVTLTAAGCTRFERMAEAHEKWIAELLQRYNNGEVEDLIGLLDPIAPRVHGSDEKSGIAKK
ncbi:MAG: MarR family winged helix-turn-helix transcriptional regulator [Beijerinckiaceae bacterium]